MSLNNKFLEKFTQELILNSAPTYILKEIEKRENKPSFKEKNNELEAPIPENIEENSEQLVEGIIEYSEKVKSLIDDPTISSIECLGPEKFILIHRGQNISPIKLELDKNEINDILDYFSKEARIPRIKGVFKAIVNNLVVTAINSEFGGPRFIITKIHPRESVYLGD
ncbi:hypothetical protein COU53_03830 [Candidatus Pacearchaeota archaeon CG10_big_fil_rev_8_21_14_0_10_30_48]|nr:MAG: hypothetical protein COU53_03830 [Candidatus Pacearchaeota archaeon CG10_big_fil_rev_8_21_14_0_10_30_48]